MHAYVFVELYQDVNIGVPAYVGHVNVEQEVLLDPPSNGYPDTMDWSPIQFVAVDSPVCSVADVQRTIIQIDDSPDVADIATTSQIPESPVAAPVANVVSLYVSSGRGIPVDTEIPHTGGSSNYFFRFLHYHE